LSEARRRKVIGIGSPLGDDQAGWLVIDALSAQLPPEVQLAKLDRPGTTLITLFENVDEIILIDAMQAGGMAGNIRHFSADEWADHRTGLSSHGFGVFEALTLARELKCLPERLDLYGIEVESTFPHEQVGNKVAAASQRLAAIIANEMRTRG
jgi:hydrogenase maturation protease